MVYESTEQERIALSFTWNVVDLYMGVFEQELVIIVIIIVICNTLLYCIIYTTILRVVSPYTFRG